MSKLHGKLWRVVTAEAGDGKPSPLGRRAGTGGIGGKLLRALVLGLFGREKLFLRDGIVVGLIYPFLMNPTEYAKLAEVEELHWYYAGKRELVRHWLNVFGPPNGEQVLLDCGAGTGRFAKEMESSCRVLVLDDHEESLQLLRKRFRPEQVIALGAEGVPLPDASVDYVTALDVLEHIQDDRATVRDMHRVLKPDGVLLVTVPASMALWSDWDEALHHHRRYDRAQLRSLFSGPEWEILHVNYTNVCAYPAIWLVRRWRRWFPANAAAVRAEDKVPSRWVNRLLHKQFTALARVRMPLPFGVSLVLAARKRGPSARAARAGAGAPR